MIRRMAVLGPLTAAALGWSVRPAPAQTSVGGLGYAQYLYQLSDSASHLNNFDVTRVYVTVTGSFTGGVGTRVTSEAYRNTDGSLALRLKFAYVAWTPESSAVTFKFGQVQTPWVGFEDALWDYRMQGQVAMDRNGYMTASDFGAGVDGRWGPDRFNAQLGFYNGENFNKAPGDQRKDLMARASYRVRDTNDSTWVGGLRVTGYAQLGKPTTGGQRRRFIGMLSYRSTHYTLAAEYAITRDSVTGAGAITPVASRDGHVVSVFGVLHLPRTRWAAIARLDRVDPNTSVAADRTTRLIGGVSYQVSPNLRLLADIDRLNYESGHPVTPAEQAVRTQGLFQLMFTF
jgi:hypothetical protein